MSSSQVAFVLEWLTGSGWKQHNVLYFRYRDVESAKSQRLTDPLCKAARVRRCKLDEEPISYSERNLESQEVEANAVG